MVSEKAAASNAVDRQEIPDSRAAETNRRGPADAAERTIVCVEVTEDPSRAEPGTRRDVCDQAGFVAELRVWSAGDDLHALDRAGGKLRRKHLALLIADRLAVDHKAGLGMVADGVEESVGVRRNAAA